MYRKLPLSDFFILLLLLSLLIKCDDYEFPESPYPGIRTLPVTDISDSGATFRAEITHIGKEEIIDHGFIWGEEQPFLLGRQDTLKLGPVPEPGEIEKRIEYGHEYYKKYLVVGYAKTESYFAIADTVFFISLGSKPPVIDSFYPKKAMWDDTVTIIGQHFSPFTDHNEVKFGSLKSKVVSCTDTTIVCIVPVDLYSTPVPINITVAGQQTRSEEDFELTTPVIESLTPIEGTWGDKVTIRGENFSIKPQYNLVKFGSYNSEVIKSTDSTIICIVPDQITDPSVPVYVSIAGIQDQSSENFIMLAPVIENFSPQTGTFGDSVTITGSKFSKTPSHNFVTFNGLPAVVAEASENILKVIVPNEIDTKENEIKVRLNFQSTKAGVPFTMLPPSVSHLSSYEGYSGDIIHILGNNFHPYPDRNKVLFEKITFTVISASKQELEIKLPRVSYKYKTGNFGITVAEQTANSPQDFTFLDEWFDGKPGNFTYQGYTYKTTTISGKEWMAENLRATHYADGTPIESGIWDYNDDPANSENYGKLYSWYTAMNGAPSSNDNPSGVQGVCPEGWHLPSRSEWEEMRDYLMNEYDLINSIDDPKGVGNALKAARQAGHPWGGEHDTNEHPRWDQDNLHFGTDFFGFSKLPGGYRSRIGNYLDLGFTGCWWSASERTSSNAWRMHLREDYGSFDYYSSRKNQGYSVRCVRLVE